MSRESRESELISSLKATKISDEQYRTSRYAQLAEEESRQAVKSDQLQSINVRLAQNFNQIVELLGERKSLIIRKVEKLHEDKLNRIDVINRGKLMDLKNEARQLKDEGVSSLIENAQRMNSTKAMLRRIVEQANMSQFDSSQKSKGKKYYDQYKSLSDDLDRRTKKYGVLMEELGRLTDKQRSIFMEIEKREVDISLVLRKKDSECIKKAEVIQDDIDKYKLVIKDNRTSKERKKNQVENTLANILQILSNLQSINAERNQEIEILYGGNDSINDFDFFLSQFDNLLKLKEEQKKDETRDKTVIDLGNIAQGYQAYAVQIGRDRNAENSLMQRFIETLKGELKTVLLEKVYLQDISSDRVKLTEVLKKCKMYRQLLLNFEDDRSKITKEGSKIEQMKAYFIPRLKALTSQEVRREELKRELVQINAEQSQLQKVERRFKEVEIVKSGLAFQKEIIEREMDEYASKGNLAEFKAKKRDLEQLEKDLQKQRDSYSEQEIMHVQTKLAGDAHALYAKYADLIREILTDQDQMGYASFLEKLSKRLSLI